MVRQSLSLCISRAQYLPDDSDFIFPNSRPGWQGQNAFSHGLGVGQVFPNARIQRSVRFLTMTTGPEVAACQDVLRVQCPH